MRDDRYFDDEGNRVKLDTRHLEWCNAHKPGVTTAKLLENERAQKRTFIFSLIKIPLFALCLLYAVKHINVFSLYLPQIVEGLAVAACLIFMGSCVDRLWREFRNKGGML